MERGSRRTYFLTSARLGFDVWSVNDLPLALALWSNADVTRLIGGPFSEAAVRERLTLSIETMRTHKVQYWPLFLLATGDFVGCCGLRPCSGKEGVLELGFHLLPTFWQRGLSEEAARAVLTYAWPQLIPRSILAGHDPDNQASRRVLEKLGFVFTGNELYAPTGRLHLCYHLLPPSCAMLVCL
jgi:ribosomal-protein-alanine N-acetyltransferase